MSSWCLMATLPAPQSSSRPEGRVREASSQTVQATARSSHTVQATAIVLPTKSSGMRINSYITSIRYHMWLWRCVTSAVLWSDLWFREGKQIFLLLKYFMVLKYFLHCTTVVLLFGAWSESLKMYLVYFDESHYVRQNVWISIFWWTA
jgi:hypothetical protein